MGPKTWPGRSSRLLGRSKVKVCHQLTKCPPLEALHYAFQISNSASTLRQFSSQTFDFREKFI